VLLASLDRKPGCAFETTVRLEEKIGLVPVIVRRLGPEPAYAEFTAPVLPQPGGVVLEAGLIAKALSLEPAEIGFSSHAPSVYKAGNAFLFVPLRSRQALARARADTGGWGAVRDAGAVGVYLYCAGEDEADFHARLFAPDQGIPEDPATGSAAATLPGPLAAAEGLPDGTHRWNILQGEDMGRPSRIRVEAEVTAGRVSAVRVGGQAVPVSQGKIEVASTSPDGGPSGIMGP
jgi:trans-2,3-dihydro-3-hydroxyanthranilate isomerase